MKHIVTAFLLLTVLASAGSCGIQNCRQCNTVTDNSDPANIVTTNYCTSCSGYFQPDQTFVQCDVNVRMYIATVLGALVGLGLAICLIMQIIQYNKTKHLRRNCIQGQATDPSITETQLNALNWQKNNVVLDITNCKSCMKPGGSVTLQNGEIFHGDCLCWQAKGSRSLAESQCRIYCIKCLKNFMQTRIPVYAQVKKYRQRVCDECIKQ